MGYYFNSQVNSWYTLDNLNLSGTRLTGTNLNLPEVGKWTTLAKFEDENISLDSVFFRSAVQEDGALSNFTATGGTTSVSLRILPPKSKTGLDVFENLIIGTDNTTVGLFMADFTPSRSIPIGSLLQAKVTDHLLIDSTGTNNRMWLNFQFAHGGVQANIEDLTDH